MNWLELYDVVFWVKGGKIFVSKNYPTTIYALSKKGYKMICEGSSMLGRLSSALNEEGGAVELSVAMKEDG